ncbi:MAG: MobF family relaxase [Nitriliruptorales bacterium]
MLNIGRMAPGSHGYYLSVVAAGVEDYYLARGEAPGRWLGRGAELLGLEGRVEAGPLRHVLAGAEPHTGACLAAHPARKVPGFDLTFRAPKSVSLLWALGDGAVAAEVRDAHDAAVEAAISFIEREAARTRRGAGGSERVEVDGLIAAAFRHRTSRAGDPLLHTHVLVANLARTPDDGVWRTLESRRLFLYAKTAGFLYQAHLRDELTRRLGVAWQPVVNGYADLAGISRPLIDAFSRRRQAILQRLDDRGETSAKAAQVATLETRVAKEGQVSEAELRRGWAKRAELLGFDRATLDQLLHRHQAREPDIEVLADELVGREVLTEQRSTFSRRDVLQAVAQRLPDGATVEHVEELADAVLEHGSDQLVALERRYGPLAAVGPASPLDASHAPTDEDEARLTTLGLLLAEQGAVRSALDRRDEGIAVVPEGLVEGVLSARRSLSEEQDAMVRRLTTAGEGVAVVVGRAGTGKTFGLAVAREAWRRAGIPVVGAALAARAALELQEAAGIPSTTVHRLQAALQDPRPGSPLAPGSVLVVDEAGMVVTRVLSRLLAHAEDQRVKVVLVGDPHQLPEIDAGGLFRALATRLPAIELSENRRQQQAWEVGALDQLRHGDPADAVAAYTHHRRIIAAETAEMAREQLVSDWWDVYDELGATSAVMVAMRQVDVEDLNARATLRLRAAGLLSGAALKVDGMEFQAGDRIVCLRNDRRLHVLNGTRATVTRVDPTARSLTVLADDGAALTLPADYFDAGHVAHGYAITGHKAQGLTVDHTFVLASPELHREWGYVALSRGRESNRLYVHGNDRDLEPELDQHGAPAPSDPTATLAARFGRSRAHQPVSDDAAVLAARWRELQQQLAGPTVRRQRELSRQRDELADRRDSLRRLVDRDQQQLDRLDHRLRRLCHRQERTELETRLSRNRPALAETEQHLRQVGRALAALPGESAIAQAQDELSALTRQLSEIADVRVRSAERHPPGYLLRSLGTPPASHHDRSLWREAARTVESYRLRWDITDPDRPLGDEPQDPAQLSEHRWAATALDRNRRELTHDRQSGRSIALGR